MPFNMFPYTNLHNLNLDWILQQVRQAQASMEEAANQITAASQIVQGYDGRLLAAEQAAAQANSTAANALQQAASAVQQANTATQRAQSALDRVTQIEGHYVDNGGGTIKGEAQELTVDNSTTVDTERTVITPQGVSFGSKAPFTEAWADLSIGAEVPGSAPPGSTAMDLVLSRTAGGAPRIKGVGAPSDPQDAANKAYVDAHACITTINGTLSGTTATISGWTYSQVRELVLAGTVKIRLTSPSSIIDFWPTMVLEAKMYFTSFWYQASTSTKAMYTLEWSSNNALAYSRTTLS